MQGVVSSCYPVWAGIESITEQLEKWRNIITDPDIEHLGAPWPSPKTTRFEPSSICFTVLPNSYFQHAVINTQLVSLPTVTIFKHLFLPIFLLFRVYSSLVTGLKKPLY